SSSSSSETGRTTAASSPMAVNAPAAVPVLSRRTTFSNGKRSEEHTSELQSHLNLVCRLLLEKKKKIDSARRNNVRRTLDKPYVTKTAGRTAQRLRQKHTVETDPHLAAQRQNDANMRRTRSTIR